MLDLLSLVVSLALAYAIAREFLFARTLDFRSGLPARFWLLVPHTSTAPVRASIRRQSCDPEISTSFVCTQRLITRPRQVDSHLAAPAAAPAAGAEDRSAP